MEVEGGFATNEKPEKIPFSLLCLDNSAVMQNGDYSPSRLQLQQTLASKIVHNTLAVGGTVALLTCCNTRSGKVLVSNSKNLQLSYNSLAEITVSQEKPETISMLQIANMCLRNSLGSKAFDRVRIFWFVGNDLKDLFVDLTKVLLNIIKTVSLNLGAGKLSLEAISFSSIFEDVKEDKLRLLVDQVGSGGLIAGHNLESALNRLLKPPQQDLSDPSVQKKREIELSAKLARENKIPSFGNRVAEAYTCRKAVFDLFHSRFVTKFVVVGQQQPKKYLASFKAGIMNWNPKSKIITPDERKGELYLFLKQDGQLQIVWVDVQNNIVGLTHKFVAREVVFSRSDIGNARAYTFKFFNSKSSSKYFAFFWSQEERDSIREKDFCFTINHYVKKGSQSPADDILSSLNLGSLGEAASVVSVQKMSLLDALHIKNTSPLLSELVASGKDPSFSQLTEISKEIFKLNKSDSKSEQEDEPSIPHIILTWKIIRSMQESHNRAAKEKSQEITMVQKPWKGGFPSAYRDSFLPLEFPIPSGWKPKKSDPFLDDPPVPRSIFRRRQEEWTTSPNKKTDSKPTPLFAAPSNVKSTQKKPQPTPNTSTPSSNYRTFASPSRFNIFPQNTESSYGLKQEEQFGTFRRRLFTEPEPPKLSHKEFTWLQLKSAKAELDLRFAKKNAPKSPSKSPPKTPIPINLSVTAATPVLEPFVPYPPVADQEASTESEESEPKKEQKDFL